MIKRTSLTEPDGSPLSTPSPMVDSEQHSFWKSYGEEEISFAEDMERRKAWRVDSETLERARAAVKFYEGTQLVLLFFLPFNGSWIALIYALFSPF